MFVVGTANIELSAAKKPLHCGFASQTYRATAGTSRNTAIAFLLPPRREIDNIELVFRQLLVASAAPDVLLLSHPFHFCASQSTTTWYTPHWSIGGVQWQSLLALVAFIQAVSRVTAGASRNFSLGKVPLLPDTQLTELFAHS